MIQFLLSVRYRHDSYNQVGGYQVHIKIHIVKQACGVQVMFNTKSQSVQLPEAPGEPLVVTAATQKEGQEPETMRITCRLLVAADGANSMVRGALDDAQPGAGWGMELYPSDAGGLAFKVRVGFLLPLLSITFLLPFLLPLISLFGLFKIDSFPCLSCL